MPPTRYLASNIAASIATRPIISIRCRSGRLPAGGDCDAEPTSGAMSLPPQSSHWTVHAIWQLLVGQLIVVSHLTFELRELLLQRCCQSVLSGLAVQVVE